MRVRGGDWFWMRRVPECDRLEFNDHSLIISRYSDNSNSNLPARECYEDGWDSLGMDEKRRKGRE